LAKIQAGLGMKKEAIRTSEESLEKAKTASDSAYIKSTGAFIKELKTK
jgi:hypothetical protein